MRMILFALLTLLLAGRPAAGQEPERARTAATQWSDPDLGSHLWEGVATATDVWIRGSSKVVRFDRQTGDRSVVAEDVIDILADGPHLWALVATGAHRAVVRDLRQPASTKNEERYLYGEPISLFRTPTGPGVLTTKSAILPGDLDTRPRQLVATLDVGGVVSDLADGALYVGYNRGEFGGGLRRIDLATGAISFVQDPIGDLCEGPLNANCSPVVGIVPDAQQAGCVLVGTSLAHMMLRTGEVFRVCGTNIQSVFAEPLPSRFGSLDHPPGQTWPFDSLIETPDGWVAVSQDRYARLRGRETAMHRMPGLHPWSGLRVSQPTDGLVFIEAACCWGGAGHVLSSVIAIPLID